MVWPNTVTFNIELTDDYSEYEISNDKLIKESVNFDERMCTGDRLKFGLCEGSVIEFQYFNFRNIRGERIFVKVEVDKQEWVDIFEFHMTDQFIITEDGDYKIKAEDNHGTVTITHESDVIVIELVENKTINLGMLYKDDILTVDVIPGQGNVIVYQYQNNWHPIPIGWFDVKECPRQASTGIYKATAINKLKSDYLNNKANTMVEERFGIDAVVSVYDIKRFLLDEYTIFPIIPPIAPMPPIGGIAVHEYSEEAKFNMFFRGGVNTLFSGRMSYEAEGYFVRYPVVFIHLATMPYTFDLSDGGHYIFSLKDKFKLTIRQLEENYKKYLMDLLTGALFEGFPTGEEVIDMLLEKDYSAEYWSWGGFMYIAAETQTTEGGTVILGYEYYSTMRKEIEARQGITPSTCSGTIDEFFDRVFHKLSTDNYTGRVIIGMPDHLIYRFGGEAPTWMKLGLNTNNDGQRIKYRYWNERLLDDQYPTDINNYSERTLSEFVMSDGNVYTANNYEVYKLDDYVNRIEFTELTLPDLQDFTLRDLMASSFETECQFGKLDRETDLFSGVELNNSRLLPADTLYPSNSLYPNGNSEHPMPSQYSKLWTDSAGVQKFRYLIITYKTLEGEQGQMQEVEKTLQRTVNNDGTVNYNMSDNWLFRNLIWTAEEIGEYADAMVAKMQDIRWFPFEMWCAGLPYLETGDEIEISVGDETHRSYILTRQLKGIHNLQDQYINGTLDIF